MQNTALIHEQTFENTSLNVQPVLTKTKVLIKIEKNDIRTCRVKNDYLAGALLLCIKTPTGHNMQQYNSMIYAYFGPFADNKSASR